MDFQGQPCKFFIHTWLKQPKTGSAQLKLLKVEYLHVLPFYSRRLDVYFVVFFPSGSISNFYSDQTAKQSNLTTNIT